MFRTKEAIRYGCVIPISSPASYTTHIAHARITKPSTSVADDYDKNDYKFIGLLDVS